MYDYNGSWINIKLIFQHICLHSFVCRSAREEVNLSKTKPILMGLDFFSRFVFVDQRYGRELLRFLAYVTGSINRKQLLIGANEIDYTNTRKSDHWFRS